jgi:aldehyde:ferredoxin oxidoreductase
MAISRSNTVSFRISAKEYGIIKRKAGALSVGDYARRSALSLDIIDRTAERKAIGKAIRAIHNAIAAGLPEEHSIAAKALLSDALRLVEAHQSVAKPGIPK